MKTSRNYLQSKLEDIRCDCGNLHEEIRQANELENDLATGADEAMTAHEKALLQLYEKLDRLTSRLANSEDITLS